VWRESCGRGTQSGPELSVVVDIEGQTLWSRRGVSVAVVADPLLPCAALVLQSRALRSGLSHAYVRFASVCGCVCGGALPDDRAEWGVHASLSGPRSVVPRDLRLLTYLLAQWWMASTADVLHATRHRGAPWSCPTALPSVDHGCKHDGIS
jgi:hypothetical protein